jgi:nucleotide-binding universal stress UspA family protein
MAQYQRILMAVDQSELAESVVTTATEIAKAHQASLRILHCLSLPLPTQLDFGDRYRDAIKESMTIAQQQLNETMEQTRQWLTALEQQATTAGVETTWDWRGGDAGPQICHVAETWPADLILMGRRGRRGLKAALLGSVSNYVMHHAPCSVLVVQGTSNKDRESFDIGPYP